MPYLENIGSEFDDGDDHEFDALLDMSFSPDAKEVMASVADDRVKDLVRKIDFDMHLEKQLSDPFKGIDILAEFDES